MAVVTANTSSLNFRRFRGVLQLVLWGLFALSSIGLFIANRTSGPPRVEYQAFAYTAGLVLHLIMGITGAGIFALRLASIIKAVRKQSGWLELSASLALLSLVVCFASGMMFIGLGTGTFPTTMRPGLRLVHDISTATLLVFGLVWLVLRAMERDADAAVKRRSKHALMLVALMGVPATALLAYAMLAPNTDRVIKNPALPPMVPHDEGDGKAGKFFPASAQTVDGQFFPSAYFMESKECGKNGCHPDVYQQWLGSAHRNSSFNNQYYRKAVEYMQEIVGVQASKWCGGCHDMAVLLTEDPHKPGKPRFDTPIARQVYPEEKYPESHAGIGCGVCHSIVHVKSTMGNSDYLADYPPMHKYLDNKNPAVNQMHTFLTRLAPEPHKKTFLRPFHKNETAKFCSPCHKVHLDIPVNNFRWIRGQNTYDEWQQSGVSGFGAGAFYYPSDEKTGLPAFKKCGNCHMPKTPSKDAGNVNGFVSNHRFVGANTALPLVNKDEEQMKETVKFLQDKALSIDIFALRRQKPGGKVIKKQVAATNKPGTAPVAASVMGDTSESAIPGAAANANYVEETLVAPLNRGGKGAALVRGEKPLVDVVVRTLKVGHAFPSGTVDAHDVWVELIAKDSKGKVIYHSGSLEWEDGPVEPSAEQYRAFLVDEKGNPIDKRNVFALRTLVYAKIIPPGAADTVHYRIPIPKDCGDKVTITAKLNYRKFTWFYNLFSYAARTQGTSKNGDVQIGVGYNKDGTPKKDGLVSHGWDTRPISWDADLSKVSGKLKEIPVQPIVTLAESSITLPVVNPGDKMEIPRQTLAEDDIKKDRMRWNDYGIGLLLQGDFLNATNAFTEVTKLAPKWSEGYVNIGRVRQAERDSKAAKEAFDKAFALYEANPTAMTPYQRARTQNFYAQTLFDMGRLEDSLKELEKAREVFPQDRNLRNLTGTIYFRLGRYEEAIQQFKTSLEIDAEDISAHYNLMKSYRGKGDATAALKHEKLYKRFKADETVTRIAGEYLRRDPYVNNLAQRIHEHDDGVRRPAPAWVKQLYANYERQKKAKSRQAKQPAKSKPVALR